MNLDISKYYRRNLPHIQPSDATFFITFRLNGSLPKNLLEDLKRQRQKKLKVLSNITVLHSEAYIKEAHHIENLYFGKFDSLLDSGLTGPKWLSKPDVAEEVKKTIHYLDNKDYSLICYCIMPNHVHLIIGEIQRILYKILQSLKRHSARESNILLNRKGAFWQKESYDNVIKDDDDLYSKIEYVLNNPIKANLVKNWKDWKYSYCHEDFLFVLD